ncbi:MAG: DNA-binding protein [Phycisphaerae bacterium]|nr:MAG: cobalamin B12-binding domain-containing protein [Planctomycetia bacterium]RIK70016.1 MAG: DNA-binding protein [Planctomycetota bacterium]GJQ26785.1 MAG: DNA-binding protein [Phycisphaerae bacterium]
MKQVLTPKQVAQAIGVSEASVKRWTDKGMFAATRTAGGHRRLTIAGVVRYLRASGHELVRPEILGLPPASGRGEQSLERALPAFREALEAGDRDAVWRMAFDLYLAGHTACDICDKLIARAFHEIGERWQHGETEIYKERRAGEVCKTTLVNLTSILPPMEDEAPVAIGATLGNDPYFIPTTMVALVLREVGWRADSYGIGLPVETFIAAVRDVQPRLVWVSSGYIDSPELFLNNFGMLQQETAARGIPIVVGGRALTDSIRQGMKYTAYCDTLAHLVGLAQTLHPAGARSAQE